MATVRQFANNADKNKPVELSINSDGGVVTEGLAIYNLIRNMPQHVTMRVDGVAASMASLILMAADHRVMPANSWLMIHNPWGGMDGDATQMRQYADQLEGFQGQLTQIYADASGLSIDEISGMMNAETWMTASEALERGFIHEVVDDIAIAAMSRHKFEAFARVPEKLKRQQSAARSQKAKGVDNMDWDTLAAMYGLTRQDGESDAALKARIAAAAEMQQGDDESDGEFMERLSAAAPDAEEDEPDADPAGEAEEEPAGEADNNSATARNKRRASARNASGRDQVQVAMRAERKRISAISQTAERHGIPSHLVNTWIDNGISAQTARAKALSWLERNNPDADGRHTGPVTGTRANQMRAAVTQAISARVNGTSRDLEANAREFSGRSLMEVARQYMMHNTSGSDRNRVINAGRNELAAMALHTTSDFPLILQDVIRKTLTDEYEEAPRTFDSWTRRTTAPDFREMSRVALGDAPQLLKVNEHGEFKEGSMGETGGRYRIETFGRIFSITRQTLINDDLDAFGRIPTAFARSAADLENSVVYDLLTSNVVMDDGFRLFSSQHRNVGTAPMPLTTESLGVIRERMRTQRGLGNPRTGEPGRPLNLIPRKLIVPAALETQARKLLYPNMFYAENQNVQPYEDMELIVDPRLDERSETEWYVACETGRIDTLEYAYLDGNEGLYIETQDGFEIDGTRVKARLDFGAGAIDYRGLFAADTTGAYQVDPDE